MSKTLFIGLFGLVGLAQVAVAHDRHVPLLRTTGEVLLDHEREMLNTRDGVRHIGTMSLGELTGEAPISLSFPHAELRSVDKAGWKPLPSGGAFMYTELEGGGHLSLYKSVDGTVKGVTSSPEGEFSIGSRADGSSTMIVNEIATRPMRHEHPTPPRPTIEDTPLIEHWGFDFSDLNPFLPGLPSVLNQDVPPSLPMQPSSTRAAPAQMRVLVLYTELAARLEGSRGLLEARIALEVERMNQALQNSGLVHRMEAVIRPLNYSVETQVKPQGQEGHIVRAYLRRLTYELGHEEDPNGVLDEVHRLRDAFKADLVALYVRTSEDFCGLAWFQSRRDATFINQCEGRLDEAACRNARTRERLGGFGFSVLNAKPDCIGSFAHEVGHNLGLSHDRFTKGFDGSEVKDADFPFFPYGFGYVNQNFTGPTCQRTIMAYGNQCENEKFVSFGSKIQELRFSNPAFIFDNAGDWNRADPSGRAGDHVSYELVGPANAARAIDGIWNMVAGLYNDEPETCSVPAIQN